MNTAASRIPTGSRLGGPGAPRGRTEARCRACGTVLEVDVETDGGGRLVDWVKPCSRCCVRPRVVKKAEPTPESQPAPEPEWPTEMPGPTPAELRVLGVICDIFDERGKFPTYREIAPLLGVSSSAVAQKVRGLAQKKLVKLETRRGVPGILAAQRVA